MEIEKLMPLVLLVLVALCYRNSLECGLVYDDIPAVRDNRDIRPHTPLSNLLYNDFWGTPLKKEQSHKSYRPLTVFSFRMNYAVHGLSPYGYHLVNVLLHALVTFMFYRLCLCFSSITSSLASASLFAVHPIHTEAVSSVVGRAELLSATAFLGALIFYIHSRSKDKSNVWICCIVTSLLALAGTLCKEQALTVLAVCCIYEMALQKSPKRMQCIRDLSLGRGMVLPWLRDKMYRVFFLSSVALGVLYCRWKIMGPRLPVFSRFDNPASVAPSPTRQLTYNYLLSVNAWLLLFPCQLCCDWTMSTIPLVTCFSDVRNVETLVLYICIICILISAFRMEEDDRIIVVMSLALVAVPFLPATNLFFPVGFVVAERVLYIPSMGFCWMVAHGWSAIFEKRAYKRLAVSGLVLILFFYAVKTIRRNEDWKSGYSLYSSGLAVNQRNGKLFNNMGQVLESMQRQDEALEHYEHAIRLQPDDVRSYLNAGRVLTNLRRFQEAEQIYLKAKTLFPGPDIRSTRQETHVTPGHLQLFLNLALLISKNDSRLEEADALYREVITLRSDFTNAYLNKGDVLLKMNRTKEAEAMYHQALAYDENNPDLYFNLGVVCMYQGRHREALDLFNKALVIEPEHEKSLEFSAVLLHESGISSYKQIAISRLESILGHGKGTDRVYINLGLMAIDNKDVHHAETWFRKALLKNPNSREGLFNLALLLSEQHRPSEALLFLERLLEHHPSHTNGLILMADIHVNHLRNLDAAEECYDKILKSEPRHEKALHNLCVLHFERQDFARAERCFLRALSLHPSAPYIGHHLQVVRNILEQGRKGVLGHLTAAHSVS